MMTSLPVLLAALTPEPPSKVDFAENVRQILLVIGVISVLTLLILIWIVSRRKPHRRHRRHGSHRASEEPATLVRYRHEQNEDKGLLSLLKTKRRRRKRRFHHRNPTLAETGGLPPVRADSPPSPGSPKQP